LPQALGVEVKMPGEDCEIDIISIHDDNGLPTVVVGEVKSRMDSIEEEDLEHLGKVQRHLRSNGIECVALVAVMRDLRSSEKEILRRFSERPLTNLPRRSQILPVLPIVFTVGDLSVPYLGEGHPAKEMAGYEGVLTLAEHSCRRNLGLVTLEPSSGGSDFYFRPVWDGP
ncbi:hypothetical protein HHX38_21545, partial [Streptomyces sp. PKU-MA01144]|uniref:hypothetical protein n=1 Tax=Streptomyces sp. PKU-MA01144 TaxID=2729138 RepID=UPI00147E132B